eukprot:Phypoly_transcript_17391.p1 GENE.Phypoly_transcript_17391~~Phypoly_transcript_17391.p1  ORF type:complete len:178 (+),score=18.92 Phypoly_transcript_17391:179-712(+)
MGYSTKPTIVFAVSGIILAMFMSIGFLMFECCYAGFGKCHPNKPKKSMPQGSMNVITCCLGHGGWHLGWIFSTALFPAILTSFLGIVLFEVIFITMPDIYSIVPREAWIVFFVLGFMVAFFSRFFLYNWYNHYRSWRDGREWISDLQKIGVGSYEETEKVGSTNKTEGLDEFTPLTK